MCLHGLLAKGVVGLPLNTICFREARVLVNLAKKQSRDGRSTEIQRLIGRSLRAAINLDQLCERLVTVDCDVLLADGGTRTASISGGWVALVDALASVVNEEGQPLFPSGQSPLLDSIAAVECRLGRGERLCSTSTIPKTHKPKSNMNIVMTGAGRFIEVQGGGEGTTFSVDDLNHLVALGQEGAAKVSSAQRAGAR